MTSSYGHDVIGFSLTRGMRFSSPGHRIKWINYEQFILLLSRSRTPVHLQKDYSTLHFRFIFWIVQIYLFILFILDYETLERKPNNCLPFYRHCQISQYYYKETERKNVWREERALTDFNSSSRSSRSC